MSVIQISKLPKKIQKELPLSIRTNRDFYNFDELPAKIREIIRPYINEDVPVIYNNSVYDFSFSMSRYSDLNTLVSIKDTLGDYLTTYFQTYPGSYPFDPEYGCNLKAQLQTKDTELRKLLVTDQINQMVSAFSNDFNLPLNVKSISIQNTSSSMATEYLCSIEIEVNGEESIKLTINSDQIL